MKEAHRVFITRTAQDDLRQIFSYIAEDSLDEAERFVSELAETIDTLSTLSERTSFIPENELFGTEYRQLLHGKYRVIYRIDGNGIFVLRVIHGSRLLEM